MPRKWELSRKLVRQVSQSKVNKSPSASKAKWLLQMHSTTKIPSSLPVALAFCLAWEALLVPSCPQQLLWSPTQVPPFSVTLPTTNFLLPNSYYIFSSDLSIFHLLLFNSCSFLIFSILSPKEKPSEDQGRIYCSQMVDETRLRWGAQNNLPVFSHCISLSLSAGV